MCSSFVFVIWTLMETSGYKLPLLSTFEGNVLIALSTEAVDKKVIGSASFLKMPILPSFRVSSF